ncbi:protein transport protein Sec16A-like [Tachysurus vachellii]|uniref:protein transport protein Sec16A-like n=1 Tax=Tachysurus vachellii TaxID=175792 RepID=UPI00296AEF92|nr:protein transport protein Sec16A-like [Tachysurus vachellii]
MGDDLAFRKLMFAAHICHVVAEVELGSRRQFELIGCDRLPYGMLALFEPFLRTETYEYVLWLTSGKAQPSFQIFKLYPATRLTNRNLVQSNHPDDVYEYCEVITRAVVDFPDRFTRSFIEWLLLLSCKPQKNAEPEWLLELKKLHRAKLANANVSDDQSSTTSTSHDVVSEIQQSECCSLTEEIPDLQPPDMEQHADPEAVLLSRYTKAKLLGKGGFGAVYKGVRIADGKKVAIKYAGKDAIFRNDINTAPRETEEVPAQRWCY